jgi:hypothetical protein
MDFFQSRVQACSSRCYLAPSSRTFNCTSENDWLVHQRAEIDPDLLTLASVTQVAHAFLYTLMDFFQSRKLLPKLLSYLLPSRRRSVALVKRLAGSPKDWNWVPTCHANKVLLQGGTRILIYIDWLLSVAPNCAKPLLSYLLPFPERSIALVKRLAGSQKGLKLSNLPH